MDETLGKDKYFILLVDTRRGYKRSIYYAPERTEELQRGTILKEQPSKNPETKTFVETDRNEVYLDCPARRLANTLTELTDERANELMEIEALEMRYAFHTKDQHQAETEVSHKDFILVNLPRDLSVGERYKEVSEFGGTLGQ